MPGEQAEGDQKVGSGLPATWAFAPTDLSYLDNGSQHPISIGAAHAVEAYLAKRMLVPGAQEFDLGADGVRATFARLVGVDADEIAFVPSTTAAEQMVLAAIGLPAAGARIVTDELHFFGSVPLYHEMERRGCAIVRVPAVDGRIRLADLRAAVEPDTRLVALSQVSTVNGFEHDLETVCRIAHDAGALVYADIIHAAGCLPVDLRASGVDFAAAASYKWLMGDFGLGFLYARRELHSRLQRANAGYFAVEPPPGAALPSDLAGAYGFRAGASGIFSVGTRANAVIAQLRHSLDWIAALGPDTIAAHSRSLTDMLKRELPRRGYPLLTPTEARAPIVTCRAPDARRRLAPVLDAAGVRVTLVGDRMRVTPSVQNTTSDVERLLSALPRG